MSETELRYMLQFARTYPIHRPADELSWSAYESLLAINDDATRDSLIKKAAKENWTRDQVREAVKAYKAKLDAEAAGTQGLSPKGTVPFVEPVPGTPYTYFVTRDTRGNLVLDLGFSNYYRPPGEFDFNESDIVMVQGSERFSTLGFELETLDSGLGTLDSELYTYHAYIINVIDGDTFNAVIDLGFGISTVQTLRLRGLDAPEIESAEGRESKVFLESLLGASQDSRGVMHYAQSPVVIKTSHSDKYDRYLVDVWIKTVHTSSNVGAQHAAPLVYVNQKLIEEGHATIVE